MCRGCKEFCNCTLAMDWHFWKENIGIFSPSKGHKDWKYEIRPYSDSYGHQTSIKEKTFRFKRLPKHWIPEFDKL